MIYQTERKKKCDTMRQAPANAFKFNKIVNRLLTLFVAMIAKILMKKFSYVQSVFKFHH